VALVQLDGPIKYGGVHLDFLIETTRTSGFTLLLVDSRLLKPGGLIHHMFHNHIIYIHLTSSDCTRLHARMPEDHVGMHNSGGEKKRVLNDSAIR
jgi:hypothetical protein